MAQLMLVNPSPRKKGKKKMSTRKKRRTPAQKRATAKLVAFNKKRRSPARKTRAPAKRKTVARRKTTAARKAPARRTYKRNPAKRRPMARRVSKSKNMLKNVVNNQIKPAAIQASGALLLDVGYGYLGGYIPDMLNQGMARHATKGVVAIALGVLAGNFLKSSTANQLALGAMTVTMHDAMKEAAAQYAPMIPLGYYNASPVYPAGVGYFSDDNGNGYSSENLGYYSNDNGSGFAQSRTESEVFDTSDI